jgi:hypothetical protein
MRTKVEIYDKKGNYKDSLWVDVYEQSYESMIKFQQAVSWSIHMEDEYNIRKDLGYTGSMKDVDAVASVVWKILGESYGYNNVHAWANHPVDGVGHGLHINLDGEGRMELHSKDYVGLNEKLENIMKKQA